MNIMRAKSSLLITSIGLILIIAETAFGDFFQLDFLSRSRAYWQKVEALPEKHVQNARDLMSGSAKPKRKDVLNAISECNKAIEIKPDYARAFAARSAANEYLDRHDESIRDIEIAIKLEPLNPLRYTERSNLKGMNLDDLNKAIEIDQGFALAYLFRGDSKCLDKDYLGAICDYANFLRWSKASNKFNDVVFSFNHYTCSNRQAELGFLNSLSD